MDPVEALEFNIEDIHIGQRKRAINQEKVDELAASISVIGLKQPITLRIVPEMEINDQLITDVPVLVAGYHRLLAMQKLGHATIPAFADEGTELESQMWEISENLHRADLSAEERSEHIAEWERLLEIMNKPPEQADELIKLQTELNNARQRNSILEKALTTAHARIADLEAAAGAPLPTPFIDDTKEDINAEPTTLPSSDKVEEVQKLRRNGMPYHDIAKMCNLTFREVKRICTGGNGLIKNADVMVAEIVEARRKGVRNKDLALKYHINESRVSQLYRRGLSELQTATQEAKLV